MLKHLHSSHRRSLSFLSEPENVSTDLPTLTHYKQTEVDKKSRKYSSRSVRHRKVGVIERGVPQKLKQRNANCSRTKANSIHIDSTSADEYQGRNSSKLSQTKMKKFMQIRHLRPVIEWTTEDACDWLKSNQLDDEDRLSAQFRTSRICGRHLADPERAWNCLNRLQFDSSRQKQDVLLKLAECLRENKSNPQTSLENNTKLPKQRHRLRPPSSMSNVTVTSVDSITSSSSPVNGGAAVVTSSSSSSDQERASVNDASVTSSSSRMRKTLSTIRHVITKSRSPSQLPPPSDSHVLHDIVVYSDVKTSDTFTPNPLKITETTTTSELIQLFIDSSSINEDVNLFVINDVTVPDPDVKDKKQRRGIMSSRRMLEQEECPLAVYKSITAPTRRNIMRRLELTQMKGIVVKVICRIGKHRPRSKQFRVSSQSSVDHVIKLALRKFGLRNVEPTLFALCDITMSGDFIEILQNSPPNWKNGSTLVMCDHVTLKDLISKAGGATLPDFKRSCSMTSNVSSESRGSSGSDSWIPYKLDKSGRLTEELLDEEKKVITRGQDNKSDDVTVEDIVPLGNTQAEVTSLRQRLGSSVGGATTSLESQKADALTVDNSVLRLQLREKDEQFEDMYRKVAQVRHMLESGLQRHHESANQQFDNSNGGSIEEEIKSTEQMINETEEMLGQLFRHQRQLLAKQKRQTQSQGGDEEQFGIVDFDTVGCVSLADVDLQIAAHQADLLSLKHKHQMLDMKMSLFVSQRKAEKFRHMIHSSLFNIISHPTNENAPRHPPRMSDGQSGHALHSCEIFSSGGVGVGGYGLALKDEVETMKNNGRVRGTILEQDHKDGRFIKGDRLLEVNGINVQSVGTDFVARILKDTTSARIVVMRSTTESSTNHHPASPSSRSEDTDDDDVIMRDCDVTSGKEMVVGSGEMADWREMSALKSDLSMLMTELEVTSRAKRELERDLARKRNRDVVLESENLRLREKIVELQKSLESDST